MHTTERLQLQVPDEDDHVTVYPGVSEQQMTTLDQAAIDLEQGPTSSMPTPGTSGRYFYATDTGNLYRDTGTAWVAFAPILSPSLTGTPTAPTPPTGDDSTRLATTAFVQQNGGVLAGCRVSGATAGTAYWHIAPPWSPVLPISWSSAPSNALNMWSAAAPTKITIPSGYGGGWLLTFSVGFDPDWPEWWGFRPWPEHWAGILLNGSEHLGGAQAAFAGGGFSFSIEVPLAAGEYVEAVASLPEFWPVGYPWPWPWINTTHAPALSLRRVSAT